MTTLTPMLATAGTEVPEGEGWVFEPKYDGIRILAFADHATSDDGVTLVSRNGLDKTRQFPEVADALRALRARSKRSFLVDGEIVAMHGDSPARFQELQSRMHVVDRGAIESHRTEHPASMIVFDLLMEDGESLVKESWRVRRKHLAALLRSRARVRALSLSDVGEDGDSMLREAHKHGWEGIIAKRADAPYEPGRRSRAWLKLKIEKRQEFIVCGWTEPRRSREHIGALLLGYYDADGALVYAGHTGTGFSRQSLADLSTQLHRIETARSPFSTPPRTNEPAHWTRPSIVVEIKFNEWTADGKLRQPVFVGVRDDKSPREVVREPASVSTKKTTKTTMKKAPTKKTATTKTVSKTATSANGASAKPEQIVRQLEEFERDTGAGTLHLLTGSLNVTNLGKVFFPETKHTKGDIMRYYVRVAKYLLPAITDRPLVMKRFPNGIRGKAFYQHRAPVDPPPSVRMEPVSDEGLTTIDRPIGGDMATLLYLPQLGAISIDPWHSRVQSVKFADYAIVDLDPGPRAQFGHVVEVALAVKDVLDALDLHAVPRTSGASGIHIVLPLPARVPNDAARMLAEVVARKVAEQYPKIATVERTVNARKKGAIYVDYLQNIRGKTVAGVYSLRAEPHATVCTPLRWSEVDERLDPTAFTIDTILDRIQTVGDLWAKGMKTPNTLEGITRRG
jgi:bifunctional non-homologous end joining protein LigD